MKAIYFILILLLIVSCSGQTENNPENKDISNADSTTIRSAISNETARIKGQPTLIIITPSDEATINGPAVIIELSAGNFSIMPIGSPIKDNEGHFHVWLDGEKRVTTNSTIVFENAASGRHSIAAELVKSDHSSLSPRIVKEMTIKVENGFVQSEVISQPDTDEFVVEADDHGFYPGNIQAKIGQKVRINFKFRDGSIYFAGLDIKGPFPTIQYKLHGPQPLAAEFTMDGETRVDSYWPSSGVHKATLAVEIKK